MIGGHPAIGAVANYVSAGQQKVEYITWIDIPTAACCSASKCRGPVCRLPAAPPRTDSVAFAL